VREGFAGASLYEICDSYLAEDIKKIAALTRKKIPTRKAEIISFIGKELENEENILRYWNKLDDLQKAAVSEALYSPPFGTRKFLLKYGTLPHYGRHRSHEHRMPTYLNLFIFDDQIPKELVSPLKRFVPRPRQDKLQSTVTVPTAIGREYGTELSALSDVTTVLQLIAQNKISVSDKTKLATKTSIKKITEVLEGGDFFPPEERESKWEQIPGPVKAFAWPVLMQSGGLARLKGSKLELTKEGKKAAGDSPEHTIKLLFLKWMHSEILDEFSRIDTIKGQRGKGKRYFSSPASRRGMIIDALRQAPVNEWIAVDELSRYMGANSLDFFVTSDRWSLYICDPQYGSLGYDGYGTWNIVEKRYLLAFLMEYLATLGIIDLYYSDPREAEPDFADLWGSDELKFISRYDGLTYVRVNGLGAWCLGCSEDYSTPHQEQNPTLTVMSNFEVVAQEMIMSDKIYLESFTRAISDNVYLLEQNTILKALDRGDIVESITAFLQQRSNSELPATVSMFLSDIGKRSRAFALKGDAIIIEAKDAEQLMMVSMDPQLKRHILCSNGLFVVVPEQEKTVFLKKMRDRGYVIR
jgi:hypothetical protein